MDLAITPVQFPKTAVRMKIDISVILDEKAIVRVSFYENDNEYQPLDVKVFHVEGAEYKAWGNDDNYIKNIVYTKLGIKPL
jgi:hypothetical protein